MSGSDQSYDRLAVCRRVLPDVHTAEDVFQATFLVLVRKARSIAKPDCLGPWLYGVAYRTALQARSAAATRRRHERQAAAIQATDSDPDLVWRDLRPILDEEIRSLPHRYQSPIILCYFEGKTKEEAAQLLGLPVGTVSSRLARAPCRCDGRRTRHADRLVPRLPWRPLSKRRGRGRSAGNAGRRCGGGPPSVTRARAGHCSLMPGLPFGRRVLTYCSSPCADSVGFGFLASVSWPLAALSWLVGTS